MLPLAILCAVVGLAVGSFLNVVIWRVPRGESVVSPPSACPSCGNHIRNRDNVPVLGWLLLRGRCRDCAERISARYPLVEALNGLLFAVLSVRLGADLALPAYLYFAAVGLALTLIDLDVQRLPDSLTLPSYPVALLLLGVPALIDHRGDDLIRGLICGAIALALFFTLWFVYPAGMGFGDVKLSGLLGLYLGWISYGALAAGLFAGFLLGAVVSVGLVLFKDAGRKTKIPFGPFLVAGCLLGIVFGDQLVDGYLSIAVG